MDPRVKRDLPPTLLLLTGKMVRHYIDPTATETHVSEFPLREPETPQVHSKFDGAKVLFLGHNFLGSSKFFDPGLICKLPVDVLVELLQDSTPLCKVWVHG